MRSSKGLSGLGSAYCSQHHFHYCTSHGFSQRILSLLHLLRESACLMKALNLHESSIIINSNGTARESLDWQLLSFKHLIQAILNLPPFSYQTSWATFTHLYHHNRSFGLMEVFLTYVDFHYLNYWRCHFIYSFQSS